MIDLRRDLFIRLAISAQKNRHLNKPFRVKHVDSWKATSKISIDTYDSKSLEKKVSNVPIKDVRNKEAKPKPIILAKPKVEKIDEKVDSILNDPVLIEIQVELEFAEQLLKKVREADAHNPKIPVIEETISRLRALLSQKMYV